MAERPTREQLRRAARELRSRAAEQADLADIADSDDERNERNETAESCWATAEWLEDEGREPEMLAPGEQDPRD